MDFGINNIVDLYNRLTPALESKVNEFKRIGITYIKKEDIWNSLIQIKWKNVTGLTLSEMVDDILNCSNNEIDKYVKKKLEEINSEANLKDGQLI